MIFDSQKIQQLIGYTFKNETLLRTAFTHKSYHGNDFKINNERLEFLGDSILGFVVSDYLYHLKSKKNEGTMTQLKQTYVSTKPLAKAIRNLGVSEYLICGQSINYEASTNDRFLENLFEALVGAIYLDGGFDQAQIFIKNNLLDNRISSKNADEICDYKSKLQIYTQSKKMGAPVYETIAKTGPEHNPQFTVAVLIAGKKVAVGNGTNKAMASQEAACRAIKKIIR